MCSRNSLFGGANSLLDVGNSLFVFAVFRVPSANNLSLYICSK